MINRLFKAVQYRIKRIWIQINGKEPICGLPFDLNIDHLRLGDPNASWVIPKNLLNAESVCFCVGAGENVSFDAMLIKNFDCKVQIFDPTPKSYAYFQRVNSNENNETNFLGLNESQSKKLIFNQYGIWKTTEQIKFFEPIDESFVSHSIVNIQKSNSYILVDVKTIEDAIKDVQVDHIDLLKIDIEGAEYEVIKALIASKIRPKIFCVEFDEIMNPLDDLAKSRLIENIADLTKEGYKLFYYDYPANYTFVLDK